VLHDAAVPVVPGLTGVAIRTTACNERISAVTVISRGTGAEFDRRLTGGCPAGG
jgi:hypothetical protein